MREDVYFCSNNLMLVFGATAFYKRAASTYFWHIFNTIFGVKMCMYSYASLKSTPKDCNMLVNIASGSTKLYSQYIIIRKFVILHITCRINMVFSNEYVVD